MKEKIPDLNKDQKIKIINKLNDKLGHPIYEDLFDTWLDVRLKKSYKTKNMIENTSSSPSNFNTRSITISLLNEQ